MNTLRGQFSFELGKKKYQASLTLNALRLMCNAMGVKLADIDKWLNDDPLTAVPAFAYYGVKNESARKGKDSGLPDFEQFCALALDDQETLDAMMKAVTAALGGQEDEEPEGN
jgi:hypothetical protein